MANNEDNEDLKIQNNSVLIHTYDSRHRVRSVPIEEAMRFLRRKIGWRDSVHGVPVDASDILVYQDDIYAIRRRSGRVLEAKPNDGVYHGFEPSKLSYQELCLKFNGNNKKSK